MTRVLLISILLFGARLFVYGQHAPTMSQYMINGVSINPAFAGTNDVLSLMLSARKQWVGLNGAPTTEVLTAHGPCVNERFAVGAQIFQDNVGVVKSTGISTMYSYYVPTDNGRLYYGLSGGLYFLRTSLSQLNPTDQGDPLLEVDPPVGLLPQFGTGVLYRSKKMFASLSVPFLLSHELSANGTKFVARHSLSNYNLFAGGGAEFELAESLLLRPSFLFKTHVSSGSQIDINMLFAIKERFEVGCSWRIKDAVIGIVKMSINDKMYATYSYDYTLSELRSFNSGSHEISLNYLLRHNVKAWGPRTLLW